MEHLLLVVLKQSWRGKKRGQSLLVDPLRAKDLVDNRIADYVSPKKGDN